MPASERGHRHHPGRSPDAYLLCLGSVAAFSALVALGVVLAGPRWESPILGLPFGAFLLGGLGGMLTQIASPAWSRQIGSHQPARLVALSLYRLLAACLLGGVGYGVLASSARASGLLLPMWLLYLGGAAFGVTEMLLNGFLLRGLGLLPSGPEAGSF